MKKIKVYYFDTNNISKEDIIKSMYIFEKNIEKANKYAKELNQKEHLISDYFKNKYIGDYHYDDNNKPLSDNVFFNISHSYGYVCIGICEYANIGVDLELIRDVKSDLIKYVSSPEEYETIKDNVDFYKIWTTKESVAKCTGDGLMKDVKSIPGLPLDGLKRFNDIDIYSKVIEVNNLLISVSVADTEEFEIELTEEVL